jgi:protein-S-isoprenylcysteine O-methyltransferase Ste14
MESEVNTQNLGRLRVRFAIRLAFVVICLGALFFVSGGSFRYWQAWLYVGLLGTAGIAVMSYLYRTTPDLLERRMRLKERDRRQRRIVAAGFIVFVVAMAVPGLDHRLGWSSVPVGIVILADLIVMSGYAVVVAVFRENRFASRVIEVERDQTVISSGPYAFVRHPMYLGSLLMYLATPVALGSWWGILPALGVPVVLIVRILNEEKVLLRDLPGYAAYVARVPYRLVPGVW